MPISVLDAWLCASVAAQNRHPNQPSNNQPASTPPAPPAGGIQFGAALEEGACLVSIAPPRLRHRPRLQHVGAEWLLALRLAEEVPS